MKETQKEQALALLRPAAMIPYRRRGRSGLGRWLTELLIAAAESKKTAMIAGRGFYSDLIAFLLPGFLEAVCRQ